MIQRRLLLEFWDQKVIVVVACLFLAYSVLSLPAIPVEHDGTDGDYAGSGTGTLCLNITHT